MNSPSKGKRTDQRNAKELTRVSFVIFANATFPPVKRRRAPFSSCPLFSSIKSPAHDKYSEHPSCTGGIIDEIRKLEKGARLRSLVESSICEYNKDTRGPIPWRSLIRPLTFRRKFHEKAALSGFARTGW